MTRDDDDREGAGRGDRKERVLHTRVPELLAEELRRLAESMRVPVSNVVRSVLEDAVTAATQLGRQAEDELRSFARRLGRERPTGAPLQGIIGFQPLRLAQASRCTLCGRALEAGDDAFLGVREGLGPLVIVGPECVPRNTQKEKADERES